AEDEGDGRAEKWKAERVLGMRVAGRSVGEEPARDGGGREDRLSLEAPDRKEVVGPHRLREAADEVRRDAEGDQEKEQEHEFRIWDFGLRICRGRCPPHPGPLPPGEGENSRGGDEDERSPAGRDVETEGERDRGGKESQAEGEGP